MKKLLQPKVLIPVVLGIALIGALLAFSDIQKVGAQMAAFQKIYLLYFLLLMIGYEVVRGAQWHYLLKSMGIHVPLRTQIFSFAAGEVTKSMPIGNYFQNYLLQQSKGTDFGRSSAATTVIILTEVAVSVVGVLILGLGDWTEVVRLVIVIGSAAVVVGVWAFRRFHRAGHTPAWITEHQFMRKVADELKQFRAGAADLMHPRILAVQALLGATYLLIGGVGLYLVARGIGDPQVSLTQALSVYFFSLAFSLMVPIPVDVGVLEISGVGAFVAVGVNRSTAVGAMLINRILSIGASLTIALIVMAVLRDELRAAMRQRSTHTETGGRPDHPAVSSAGGR